MSDIKDKGWYILKEDENWEDLHQKDLTGYWGVIEPDKEVKENKGFPWGWFFVGVVVFFFVI